MDPLAAALARSPELFPLGLDTATDSVSLIRLSRPAYQQASFLDGRVAAGLAVRSVPWRQLEAAVAAANLPERCDFIFHLGHVGSTLLSRLLGKHQKIFALREPEILRTVALARDSAAAEARLPVLFRLFSRTFEASQRAIVKTTSFTFDLALPALARSFAPRLLLMGVKPEIYLATIFGGANAPAEARALAPFRLSRLERRLKYTWQLDSMSQGETIAMSWACEALALASAADKQPERAMVLDFDSFLARPRDELTRAFGHFGVVLDSEEADRILSSEEVRRYSKAPEHHYDAQLRTAVLNQGRAQFGPEIRRGLNWLDRQASGHPELARVLRLFA